MVDLLERRRSARHQVPSTGRARLTRAVPVLCVIGSILSLQVGSGYATTLFAAAGAAGVTALRIGLSAVLLVLIFRPRIRSWDRDQWAAVVLFGITLAVMNGFFYAAIARIPFGIAVTIEFLGPLGLAAAMSRRVRDFLWVGCAFTGVAVIGLHNAGAADLDLIGVGYAVLAAFGWAAYIVAGARMAQSVPGPQGLAGGLVVATLIVAPIGIWQAGAVLLHPAILLGGVLVAVLSSAIPYGLEIRALRTLPKKTFSILVALEPAAAVVTGALMLGQHLDALTISAIVLVIVAGVGATIERRERPRPADSPGEIVLAP